MNLEQIIAESVLGTIQWGTDTEGFCQCPGAHLHTTTNQKKRLYSKNIPSINGVLLPQFM